MWRVTELTGRRSFTWQARSRGVTSVGWHRLAADGDSAVTTLEADGLRRAAESG
ncbi:hypothetical protein GCM10017786_74240 [Amycolatopsis deserti]|uniref:Uncharacterized protein n=1 Tax=Amycolatopsis deserti TaxID=185696 RepID=A0ABQ3JJA9_9PSEU|nr:hypothetical protein [Amycolatopsis deserti]GHF29257.1 hypothetical protein GCM10017786_74240 [Amycolatopsis deserti]